MQKVILHPCCPGCETLLAIVTLKKGGGNHFERVTKCTTCLKQWMISCEVQWGKERTTVELHLLRWR